MNTEINREIDSHLLKREIKYYSRRSMKEMDEFIAGFTAAKLESLTVAELLQLRDLLLLPDEPIIHMLDGKKAVPAEFSAILPLLQGFQTPR